MLAFVNKQQFECRAWIGTEAMQKKVLLQDYNFAPPTLVHSLCPLTAADFLKTLVQVPFSQQKGFDLRELLIVDVRSNFLQTCQNSMRRKVQKLLAKSSPPVHQLQ